MQTTLIRLKPHDIRRGHVIKRYTYAGIRFAAGEWCCVDTTVADYLRTVHQTDRYSPLAFELGDEEPTAASAPPPHAVAPAAFVDAVDVEALVAELALLVVEPLVVEVEASKSTSVPVEPTPTPVGPVTPPPAPPTHVVGSVARVVESALIEPATPAVESVTLIDAPPSHPVELVTSSVESVLLAAEPPADEVEVEKPAAVADAPPLVVCATAPAPPISTAADDAGGLETSSAPAPAPSRGHASQRRNGLQKRVRDAQCRRDEARPDPADRRPSRGRPAPMLPPPSRRQRGPPGCSP